MVEEGREENSNSQKDNLLCMAIENCPGAKRKSILKFSDNSQIILLKEIIKKHGLAIKQGLSVSYIKALKQKSLALEIEQCAFRLISKQFHSCYLLKLKLEKRGFNKDSVQYALNRMQELGYLNDRVFAESWISSRIKRHNQGRSLLLAGLLRKGIDRKMAKTTIDRIYLQEDEARCLFVLIKKLQANYNLSYEKLFQRLIRRGFSANLIYKVLKQEQISTELSEEL